MKKSVISIATISLLLTAGAVEVDGIVATVGSHTILRSEVMAELRRDNLDEKTHFVEVRNALIERCLILKAAEGSKMSMQEWVVENRIREIINTAFDGDRNRLMAVLSKQNMSYVDWAKRAKENLIVDAMRWNYVDKNVSASPSEMREEYEKHPERYCTTDRVYVSVVTVKPGETKPEKFDETLAKKYDAVDPKEAFNPQIRDIIVKLKKGETSSWIDINGWSFKIRKTGESASHPKTFAEAYDEIEMRVKAAQAQKIHRDWIESLKAELYIKVF